MPEGSELYDQDFFLWTQEQAAALRRAKAANLPLDWENLAEEIESLGKSDRRELRSQIRRILRHLFKLEASSAAEPRAGWRSTINDSRSDIEDVLRDSPSLRREVESFVSEEARLAAKFAADQPRGSRYENTATGESRHGTFLVLGTSGPAGWLLVAWHSTALATLIKYVRC